VLWSDHGWKLGEHNGWCKQTDFEIDTRVPLIIRKPGAKANGQACDALVEFVDIYPTLCESAGLPVPKILEGKSLIPLLGDISAKFKDAAFSQFPRKHNGRMFMGYAMRTQRYRYIEWVDKGTGKTAERELYDHEVDPSENENVAGKLANTKLIGELGKRLWRGFDKSKWVSHQAKAKPKTKSKAKSKLTRSAKAADPAKRSMRPNILFLMADDWSWPHAGAYGDPAVKTPTFDRIAREGVLFSNAHVSSPSCTPSRMSIVTGQWHWRLRDAANLGGSLDADVKVYPELLQDAGYLIGLSRKGAGPSKHQYTKRDPFGPRFKTFEDFIAERKNNQSFCYWDGAGEPHRPYLYGEAAKADMDLTRIKLPECLPDNETTRNDFADYLHRVQLYDKLSGRIIAQLEKAGELENTIVVMAGDNGMPFPRCKATLYDTGTHVPLAIRWGAKIKGGRTVEDFVSLTDLAPTFLEATGLKPSADMTGRSLVAILESGKSGQVDPTRQFVLAGMDRHVFANPSRAIRTSDYLYILNYTPAKWPTGRGKGAPPVYDFTKRHWPSGAEAFSFNIDPSPTKQYMLLHRDDAQLRTLNGLAFGPRPTEELYDLRKDPQQLKNVAAEPQYSDIMKQLRAKLEAELFKSDDPRQVNPPKVESQKANP
jgi:N-sulfoglucosamine sulfohydrolase